MAHTNEGCSRHTTTAVPTLPRGYGCHDSEAQCRTLHAAAVVPVWLCRRTTPQEHSPVDAARRPPTCMQRLIVPMDGLGNQGCPCRELPDRSSRRRHCPLPATASRTSTSVVGNHFNSFSRGQVVMGALSYYSSTTCQGGCASWATRTCGGGRNDLMCRWSCHCDAAGLRTRPQRLHKERWLSYSLFVSSSPDFITQLAVISASPSHLVGNI